jgi:hypothetical protein
MFGAKFHRNLDAEMDNIEICPDSAVNAEI